MNNKTLSLLLAATASFIVVHTSSLRAQSLTDGLVAYYPFNGNSNDASGNGNHGTVAGDVTGIVDRFGRQDAAYRFPGVDGPHGVTLPGGLINIGQQEYTISMWFNMLDFSKPTQALLSTDPHTGIAIGFDINRPGYLIFNLGPGGTAFWDALYQHGPKNDYIAGEWYHVALTKGATEYVLSVNGTADAVVNLPQSASYDDDVVPLLGGDSLANFVINGSIDDVRIYNRALSEADIAALYEYESTSPPPTPTDGLVAYYPFNGNANDESGNSLNGVVSGAVLAPDRFGTADRAYFFNGSARIDVPSFASVQLSTLSFSCWVYVDSYPTDDSTHYIIDRFSYEPGQNRGFQFYANSFRSAWWGGELYNGTDGLHYQARVDYALLPASKWQHFAFVLNNRMLSCYTNGVLASTATSDFDFVGGDAPLTFGTGWFPTGSNASYTGYLDDVRVYNRALSSQEVAELYALESASEPCIPRAASAEVTVVNGFVVGATLTDAGCGYTETPTVVIRGSGTGATATAAIADGVVTGITITNAGSGYGDDTRMLVGSPPFMPTLEIAFSRVIVTIHVVLGKNYVLQSSLDLTNWAPVGPVFTAEEELLEQEFDVVETGRHFRIQEVP